MEDVALDDTVDAKLHNEVVARLETAEKKLRCLMGTERGKAIAQLETELEERDETIAALRASGPGPAALAADARRPRVGSRKPARRRIGMKLRRRRPRDAGSRRSLYARGTHLMRAESRASDVSFDSDGPATPVKPAAIRRGTPRRPRHRDVG